MEPLDEIARNRRNSRELATELGKLDDELADLIRLAFAAGFTGPEIGAAAGISKERTYQIRDGRR